MSEWQKGSPPVDVWLYVAVPRQQDTWFAAVRITEDGMLLGWDYEDLGYSDEDVAYWHRLPGNPPTGEASATE